MFYRKNLRATNNYKTISYNFGIKLSELIKRNTKKKKTFSNESSDVLMFFFFRPSVCLSVMFYFLKVILHLINKQTELFEFDFGWYVFCKKVWTNFWLSWGYMYDNNDNKQWRFSHKSHDPRIPFTFSTVGNTYLGICFGGIL